MNQKLFSFIFVGLIIIFLAIFCFKTIQIMDKSMKDKMLLNCAEVYLTDMKNYNDYQHLCTNDNCTTYFVNRINQSIAGFNRCFEIYRNETK